MANLNADSPRWDSKNVANHYDQIANIFFGQPDDTLVCHFGIIGEDGKSYPEPEPVHHARHYLINGLELQPGMRVLDAGCGMGGNVFALAAETGASMTGLDTTESFIPKLKEIAKERKLDHLCEFHLGDFNDLMFPDCHFDVVLMHETFGFVHEREKFLRGIYRVLKPGGRWQIINGGIKSSNLDEDEQKIVDLTIYGWRLAPMVTLQEVLQCLENAGFVDIRVNDITVDVMQYVQDVCDVITDRMGEYCFSGGYTQEYVDYAISTLMWNKGLKKDIFDYYWLSGQRPYE